MTLARAFKIRNKLKTEISKYNSLFTNNGVYWKESERPDFKSIGFENNTAIFRHYLYLTDILNKLQQAIIIANVNGQIKMANIETCKDYIREYKFIRTNLLSYKPVVKVFNPVTGTDQDVKYELYDPSITVTTIDILIKEKEKEMARIEDELAAFNTSCVLEHLDVKTLKFLEDEFINSI